MPKPSPSAAKALAPRKRKAEVSKPDVERDLLRQLTKASEDKSDPDVQFFRSLVPQFKRLDDKGQAIFKMRVQQILFSAEFGCGDFPSHEMQPPARPALMPPPLQPPLRHRSQLAPVVRAPEPQPIVELPQSQTMPEEEVAGESFPFEHQMVYDAIEQQCEDLTHFLPRTGMDISHLG